MKNVLAEITRLRLERGWNEYELAKHCGLSQSTISTWYRKNQTPTIQTLDKVCKGLGISLSQFFAEGSDAVSLTPEQKDICQNNSAGTNGEILFHRVFRGGIFVIVCGLILISVLPGSVGHEIHFFHNLSTAFYTDTDIELAP